MALTIIYPTIRDGVAKCMCICSVIHSRVAQAKLRSVNRENAELLANVNQTRLLIFWRVLLEIS